MRPRYLFITILVAAIFSAILVMRASGSLDQRSVPSTSSPNDQVLPADRVESTAIEPLLTQALPPDDGPALLEKTCTQCHTTRGFKQTTKSRAEWEKTLAQMETMGANLEESEKVTLLDYLTTTDQQ